MIINHMQLFVPATAHIKSLDPDKTAVSVITYAEIMVGVSGGIGTCFSCHNVYLGPACMYSFDSPLIL
jgi:hypothetical protein